LDNRTSCGLLILGSFLGPKYLLKIANRVNLDLRPGKKVSRVEKSERPINAHKVALANYFSLMKAIRVACNLKEFLAQDKIILHQIIIIVLFRYN